jgi:DNA-binding phage protein
MNDPAGDEKAQVARDLGISRKTLTNTFEPRRDPRPRLTGWRKVPPMTRLCV